MQRQDGLSRLPLHADPGAESARIRTEREREQELFDSGMEERFEE